MPDTKFSFAALKEHIRKYLWFYIVGVAICLVMTNLLWTTTAPRPPMEETVVIYLADSFIDPAPLKDIEADVLARTQAYDETLKEVQILSLPFQENDYTSSMLMVTRMATGEGDAFLCGQAAMDYIIGSGVSLPLDDAVADGWMAQFDLEPFYASVQENENSEPYTILAGLKLDKVTGLAELQAMQNEGAYLTVASNGTNIDTTMKALEILIEDLMEASHAAAEGSEPAA